MPYWNGSLITPILSRINAVFHIACLYAIFVKTYFLQCEVVNPTPNPKLEYHFWSAVYDCLFDIFAADLHIWRHTHPSKNRGDVACRGDRNLPILGINIFKKINFYTIEIYVKLIFFSSLQDQITTRTEECWGWSYRSKRPLCVIQIF